MTTRKLPKVLATIAAFAALTLAGSSAAGAGARGGGSWHADFDAGFGFSQGDCCFYWYNGKPTKVTAARLGSATLTTYFIQCSGSIYICNPQYSDLLITFEAHDSTLTIDAYAPNVGVTTTNSDGKRELDVTGTWTVISGTGRYTDASGSGTFTLKLVEAFGRDWTEHIVLDGSLRTH